MSVVSAVQKGLTVERWGRNEREIVEHPGAVAIVSVDTEGQVAFVRQLREATRSHLLEIPAGTCEPGEEPLGTAKRELREECGLTGGAWSELGAFFLRRRKSAVVMYFSFEQSSG